MLAAPVDGLFPAILCFITMDNDVIYDLTVNQSAIIRYVKRKCHLFKRIRNEYGASNSCANRQLSGVYKRGDGTNVEKLIEHAF